MYLIFDFDGTVINSYHWAVHQFNQFANQFNFKKIELSEFEMLRNLSSREIIGHLKIPRYKLPHIIYHMKKSMRKNILTIPSIPLMPNVIEKLYHSGFTLGILTSNSTENVHTWLESQHLRHVFHFIESESKLFSKHHSIKKLIKTHKLASQKVVYVGDETRDIEAANRSGVRSIAVTWGYNSEKVMLESNPTFLARKPLDILNICGIED